MVTLKTQKPRKGALYTPEERSVINIFKEEYRMQTSAEHCGHIFQSKILPAIFDYWEKGAPDSINADEVNEHVKVSRPISY